MRKQSLQSWLIWARFERGRIRVGAWVPPGYHLCVCLPTAATLAQPLTWLLVVLPPRMTRTWEHLLPHDKSGHTWSESSCSTPSPSSFIVFSVKVAFVFKQLLIHGICRLHKLSLSKGKVNLTLFKQIENVLVHVTGKSQAWTFGTPGSRNLNNSIRSLSWLPFHISLSFILHFLSLLGF